MNKIFFRLLIVIVFLIFLINISCAGLPEELLPKEEDSVEVLLEKARNAYDLGYKKDSIETYQTLIDRYPNERVYLAWAYYEMGFIYFEMKEFEIALEKFYQVVENYIVDNEAAYKLAYKLLLRIEYAFETDNMEILKHNSSYAIPEDYDPLNKNGDNSDGDGEDGNENGENNSSDSNDGMSDNNNNNNSEGDDSNDEDDEDGNDNNENDDNENSNDDGDGDDEDGNDNNENDDNENSNDNDDDGEDGDDDKSSK